jgi:hypothetical protein
VFTTGSIILLVVPKDKGHHTLDLDLFYFSLVFNARLCFTEMKALHIQGCIQKFPGWVNNEINMNDKHSLRSNTKGYGGKPHETGSQNSDTTAPSGRELYHLQFSLQVASLETFGYTLVPLLY